MAASLSTISCTDMAYASLMPVCWHEVPAELRGQLEPEKLRNIALQLNVPAGEEHRIRAKVRLTMPDQPMFRNYMAWARATKPAGQVGLLIEGLADWQLIHTSERLQDTCRSMRETGRPALVWFVTYYLSPAITS